MLYMLQILPLRLHLLVGFHFNVRLAPLETVLLIDRYEVVEQQCVSTFLLIFWQDANEHEVEALCFVEFQGSHTMPPAKRPEASVLTLLQGTCHISYRNAHTYHLMVRGVPVFYQTKHIHVEHGEIHLQILINLALSHLRIAIEMTKRLIDDIEHLTTILYLAKYLAWGAWGVGCSVS